MTRRRSTIAGGMIVILVVALVLAVFRLGSWDGLGAIVPFGFTAMLARIGSGPGRDGRITVRRSWSAGPGRC